MTGVLDHLDGPGIVISGHTSETELLENGQAAGHRTFVDGRAGIDCQAHLRDVEIARGQRARGRTTAMAAPHGLQRAIQRHQLATIGGRGVQKPLVDARVAAGIEQVDAGGRPIAPRAAAHLIELDIAKGHMVEDHMTDVGDVHPLAKGGG